MSSVKFEKRAAQVEHKNTLNNLRAQQKNEREKIKNSHSNTMREINHQNKVQIDNARIEHKNKYMQEVRKQEESLEQLKASLDQVKNLTEKEKQQILQEHQEKKEAQSLLFEADYTAKKEKMQMQMQDLDHEANSNIQKIERMQKMQEQELLQESEKQKRHLRENHLTHMDMKKSDFNQKRMHAEGKFETSLRKQKEQHTEVLVRNERQHTKKMEMDNKVFNQKHQNIERTGKARTQEMQTRFENRFQKHFNSNEGKLQELAKKKEKIVNQVKSMLKQDVKISMEKENDPFYKNTMLTPELSENIGGDGYTLSMKVPKYDANRVNLSGSGRSLKLSMDRDYSFTKETPEGVSTKVSKTETISQKMSVDKIIDSKSIKKSYDEQTGVLTFKIGLS